jgi:hypothetical protein
MVQAFQRSDWAGCAYHLRTLACKSSTDLPHGDTVGAMLLAALMLGTLGVTLHHVVSATA